jgi:alginate O-acetyltransferase complex protein AlgI
VLFNSLQFLIFFPVVTLLYFLLPHGKRWMMLLIASCVFYMAYKPVFILILVFTIIIDYISGISIENASGKQRRIYLLMSLLANIGVLAFFKYFNFLAENIVAMANMVQHPVAWQPLKILLPIGLSFHTFQAMSYTIEVYRGNQKAEQHFGIFSLYVLFYPQLVAGPIERPQNLLHQFREKQVFDYTRVADGLKLMLWGLFKKIVVADRLAAYVDQVYNDPTHYHGLPVMIATVFFAFQIYCDFSGYTDIAIGAAQVMGFRLMDNFNRPYFSRSVSEFWKRWHISLSSWFRDYLYISLGGNRVTIPRWYLNLFITFLISGLWHGAHWTFIIWGALNGLFVIGEHVLKTLISRLPGIFHKRFFGITTTFILINFSWIFFRASSLHNARIIISNMVRFSQNGWKWDIIDPYEFALCICGIIFMEWMHYLQRHNKMRHFFSDKPLVIRWATYSFILWAIWIFGVFGEREFYYFVF